MSAHASITVQFKPHRLIVLRDNEGTWVARLYRDGEDQVPVVVAGSAPDVPGSAAHISLESGEPRLKVGFAAFAVPTRQLKRLGDWIQQQNAPVAAAGDSAPVGADA